MTRRTLARQNAAGEWSVATGPETGLPLGGLADALAYSKGRAGIPRDSDQQPTPPHQLSDQELIELVHATLETPEPDPTE